jgi:catechol 2,3-dioxygenase-like lactoylglutathione lyase family enzyme
VVSDHLEFKEYQMIEVQGMSPMLSVFDMPTSLKFYCDVLGWRVSTTQGAPAPNSDWAYLTLNGMDLWLKSAYEQSARPPKPEPQRVAAHHDATLYFGCPDVDAAYEYLKAAGANVQAPVVAGFGLRQVYVSDPDGYLLCFQWKGKPRVL